MNRILVIDDDEIVSAMLAQLFTEAGYEVKTASDGSRGLNILKAETFDLIVTDIVMPNKEGLETILAIRKTNKTVPIIAISGGGQIGPDQYLTLAQQFGATHALRKPLDIEEVLAVVQSLLT